MSRTPTEDLVVIARQLDPESHSIVLGPWLNEQVWREEIPKNLKKIWGRLDYGERLCLFVKASELAALKKEGRERA